MGKTICDHNWEVYFDDKEDVACYNDGFNYRPSIAICTKCKKIKKIKYGDEPKWYEQVLFIPVFVVIAFYLAFVAPVIIVIAGIKEEFFSKQAR